MNCYPDKYCAIVLDEADGLLRMDTSAPGMCLRISLPCEDGVLIYHCVLNLLGGVHNNCIATFKALTSETELPLRVFVIGTCASLGIASSGA